MSEDKRSGRNIIIVLLVIFLLLLGYGIVKEGWLSTKNKNDSTVKSPVDRVDTGFVLTGPDSFDSADTPILVGKNKNDNTVTFYNLDTGRKYTLSIDGTTHFYDKYGESISLAQIEIGDIVDVTFLKDSRHLTSMRLSSQAWKSENISRYEFNHVRGEVSIGEEIFKLTKNTQYLSSGRAIEEIDLNAADVLSFQGIDNQVLSVSVEKGHGYLRLENDESFVGGWIEVGQQQIRKITEDMLLVVPEGSYQVDISHKGGGGTKSVVINRNEETSLDIGDLEIPEPLMGAVVFSITPAKADLYIDGNKTDFSQPVKLEYGIHQLIVKADNYKSITQYIRVGQASAGVDIELEGVEPTETEGNDADGNGDGANGSGDSNANGGDGTSNGDENGSGTGVTDVSRNYYMVHIDAPEGVEAYLDGNYVGITPCSFKKEPGAHALTLRKTGYKTRSYTVQVDNEDRDMSFSFASLEAADTLENALSNSNILDANGLVSDIISNILGKSW